MGIPVGTPITVKGTPITKDFLTAVVMDSIPGYSVVHKFGTMINLTTTLTPVCAGGVYEMPTGTVTLEALSTSVNDSAAGSGIQEIKVEYLDANFDQQVGTIEMNGTSASLQTISGVKRLIKFYGIRSGTYASSTVFSQQGEISLQVSGGGAIWGQLPILAGTLGSGQSLIGAYTVPRGKRAYMLSQAMSADSNKAVNFYFLARTNANDTTPPYTGVMRLKHVYSGVATTFEYEHQTMESYEEYTDILFFAKVSSSGTADASAEFELLLEDI